MKRLWSVRRFDSGAAVAVLLSAATCLGVAPNTKIDGYRGIWFTLGTPTEYGPKYSGGLGTYTAKHRPMAVYAEEVNKTFFLYGGHEDASGDLLIMASHYDHATCEVPRPTVVLHKQGVNDPHDDPALLIDENGYLWVFISGRGTSRTGWIYRSVEPYSTEAFEWKRGGVGEAYFEITYPQPWYITHGVAQPLFFHMFTRYTAGRELYFATSTDGVNWSDDPPASWTKLAGFGGHYQASAEYNGKICTFFNYHPSGVDTRTNLYYLQTTDYGQTWTKADGTPVSIPLNSRYNDALLVDYQAQGRLMYVKDLNFDKHGNPLLLYITSDGYAAGPASDPRTWTLARWTGQDWVFTEITDADHNYDMGSLWVEGDTLRLIAPTEVGPQPFGTGGEVAVWVSVDLGATWRMVRQSTSDSIYNHTYVRRPVPASDPFYAFWADGNPFTRSESRLYFCNRAGTRVYRLPYTMAGDVARPELVEDFSGIGTPPVPLWRSRFETSETLDATHDQAAMEIYNMAGTWGWANGDSAKTYAAYGQAGVGSAPVAEAGSLAIWFPNDRSNAIDTTIPSDQLDEITMSGFFRVPFSAPVDDESYVARRLVSQKRSDSEGNGRLAIGIHAGTGASSSGNVLAIYYRDTSENNHLELGTTVINANQWYHFALVYDGADIRWYLDGQLEGSVSNANLDAPGSAPIIVGNHRGSGLYDRGFYGFIDEVRIAKRAYDVAEFMSAGGACPAGCGGVNSDLVWCSSFEQVGGGLVSHGQTVDDGCYSIVNDHGADGWAVQPLPLTYAAYGQPGVGSPSGSVSGDFALAWPDDRGLAIDTGLSGNSGDLASSLTLEGWFQSLEAQPVTTPGEVGRRLITQKSAAGETQTRLAIGLHADASGQHNVLSVAYRVQADPGTVQVARGSTPVAAGQWYHFALVLDQGELRWYLDGALEGSLVDLNLVSAGDASLVIGNGLADGSSDRGFHGFLDEIRIMDIALGGASFLLPDTSQGGPCLAGCNYPFADLDGDGDVDQSDFGTMQRCLTSSGGMTSSEVLACDCLDRDGDREIDADDLWRFIDCMGQPDIPWSHSDHPLCNP